MNDGAVVQCTPICLFHHIAFIHPHYYPCILQHSLEILDIHNSMPHIILEYVEGYAGGYGWVHYGALHLLNFSTKFLQSAFSFLKEYM
jgi:hypothetical protein